MAEVTVVHRAETPLSEQVQRQELPRGLGHLGIFNLQEVPMHPEIGEPGTPGGFCLRYFIGVVNRNMVFTSTMNIKKVSQVLGRHGRTFDMPARKPLAPWAVPFHLALFIFRRKFPECKIRYCATFSLVNSGSSLQAFNV